MKEYRCTRNAPYSHPCDGRSDRGARNGYYIRAETAQDAMQRMVERFPEETSFGFTVDEWKNLSWLAEQL
ncbi:MULTISPECIES: hypothetical protein [unclassified Microcoleus]|uniref:hypothetical protein n=1 Tax=unclassified Microcoleus TaxID=2642155 RepID=UPI002FD226AC